jgi:hypothetical protein
MSFCEACSGNEYLYEVSTSKQFDGLRCKDKGECLKCFKCPARGAICDGTSIMYIGSVWHDPDSKVPTSSTEVYTCVNNGCPDEGASEMKCKKGFVGPLCALCAPEYFKALRGCKHCEKPRGSAIAWLIAGAVTLAAVAKLALQWYRHLLSRANTFAHLKIVVSFITVVVTLDSQFGQCFM